MTTNAPELSIGTTHRRGARLRPARFRGRGSRFAQHAVPALVAVTLCIALAGGGMAVRTFVQSAHARLADGRVETSFGPLWIKSLTQVSVPRNNSDTDSGMPFMGSPDTAAVEVVVRLSNTTAAPVPLTPARFGLRLAPGDEPIPVRGAGFESVSLLPGAVYDARLQFAVDPGSYQLSLAFSDPDGSAPISMDLGKAVIHRPTMPMGKDSTLNGAQDNVKNMENMDMGGHGH